MPSSQLIACRRRSVPGQNSNFTSTPNDEIERVVARLIWSAQPRVLPGKGDGLKGSSDPGEFTVTVAKLHRLMLRKRDRDRPTDSRIGLKRPDLEDVVDGGFTAVPVVAIHRGPQPRLYVVTQMHFDRAYRCLRQSILALGELAARQVLIVRGEQPNPSICIQDPIAPPPGEAKFRFEAPAVGTRVDQVAGVVLACWRHDLDADA